MQKKWSQYIFILVFLLDLNVQAQVCTDIFSLNQNQPPLSTQLANFFRNLAKRVTPARSESMPVQKASRYNLGKTAATLGFEFDPKAVQRISSEIEIFLKQSSLSTLADELGGRNGLSGRMRNAGAYNDLLFDTSKTEDEKRAYLVNRYREKMRIGNVDILQLIRGQNNLEKDLGGFSNLWTGFYQYVFDNYEIESMNDFVSTTHSMDGLLFKAGPDPDSLIVYADSHDDNDPLKILATANSGQAFLVSQISVYRQKSGGTSLKFSAVIHAYKSGEVIPDGATLVEPSKAPVIRADNFLVFPFKVDRENIALAKNEDGTYSFYFLTGYKFRARIDTGLTPNGHDISSMITNAILDSGLSFNQVDQKFQGEGVTRFSLSENVSQNQRDLFERAFSQRVSELSNPVAARLSRASTIAIGVDRRVAEATEFSGFQTSGEAYSALAIAKLDGTSTGDRAWHADYPSLRIQGTDGKIRVLLSVDDRIYGIGHYFPGMENVRKARASKMTPIQTPGGAYLVFCEMLPAFFWSGYYEHFAVFANLELAKNFIATHRFVVGQKR